jgi:hypothetical protein
MTRESLTCRVEKMTFLWARNSQKEQLAFLPTSLQPTHPGSLR